MKARELIYVGVIAILLILFGRQCEKSPPTVREITVYDTVKTTDSVSYPVPVDTGIPDQVWMRRLAQLQSQLTPDTILDTITQLTLDTVFMFVGDYLTPKTYLNEYSDSNYILTVKDSVLKNALVAQWIDIQTVNKTVRTPLKNQLLFGVSPTVGGIYGGGMLVHKNGWAAGGGYDPIGEQYIVHVYIRAIQW